MPRTLSTAAAASILAGNTSEVLLLCLTISGDGLDTLRAVNNTEPLVRTGGTWRPYPFDADLPEDSDNVSPTVTLRVENVDRQVIRALRTYEGVPQVTVELVLASDPDTVEIGPLEFSLLSAEWDELVITGQLGYEEDFLNQLVPSQTYTPVNSPGQFV